MKTRKMLVLHGRSPLIDIEFLTIVRLGAFLPFASCICCVLTSLVLHFEEATRTHCKVPNYLPSISAATGDFSPEKYVWRIGIAYHSMLRLLLLAVEYQMLHSRVIGQASRKFTWITSINAIFYAIENFALVLLTYISSQENYSIHEKSFIVFMATSMLHMFVTCALYYSTCKSPATYEEKVSLARKVTWMLVNYCSFGIAVYMFIRHNAYCEPGIYSLFAFFEYITVFSNILFNYAITYDLKGQRFSVGLAVNPTIKQN